MLPYRDRRIDVFEDLKTALPSNMVYGFIALFAPFLLVLLYYYFCSMFDFWERREVNGPKPIPICGTVKDVMLGKLSLGIYLNILYDKFPDDPLVGFFMFREPAVLLRNLDLVKDVLIKDFGKFSERHIGVYEKAEPFSVDLSRLETARWRPLRTRLTPVFTSGKTKEMFHLLLECANQLETYLDELLAKSSIIECKELTAKYTTEVIGSFAFGIEMNSLSDDANEFRRMSNRVFRTDMKTFVRNCMMEAVPWLYTHFGQWVQDDDVTQFFTRIINETIQYRKMNNVHRDDFVNTLIDLRDNPDKLGADKLTKYYIAAQAFTFFMAGHETSSMTMTNALYELALNKDVQDKVRQEIDMLYQKTAGKIEFGDINEMKYLDMFYKEVLRKYPVLMYLSRKATSNYTFRGTKATIPKGCKVFIPAYAIHRDPNIFPDPETFDPERYSEENMNTRHPMSFLSFGNGPRNCIGARFANYQTKIGIIKILHNHQIDVCEKTLIPYRINYHHPFILQPKGGTIYVKITKIKKTVL